MGSPLEVFVMIQCYEKISPLVESLWSALHDEVHIMSCYATGVCDVIQDARHFGTILDFTEK